MGRRIVMALLLVLALSLTVWGVQTVKAADEAYVTLTEDTVWEDLAGGTRWVDLNGYDLTVSGSGTLYAFDSANDGYDAAACGTVTNNGTVQVVADVEAPNGNRYIAVSEGATTTMHRLAMELTDVTLRPSAAGLYYKATYHCDQTLTQLVGGYGVVLSTNNMPGADFLTETGDINRYTVAKDFQSGVTVTSGSVFGIFKEERTASQNDQLGKLKVYANPYLKLAIGKGMTLVGDTENCGKTAADATFNGHAYSLQDVLNLVDGSYYSYDAETRKTVDSFCDTWKEKGMAEWSFTNIKRDVLRDLELNENGEGYCPVCRKTVTWTAIDPANYTTTSYGTMRKGSHLYLTGSVVSSSSESSAFISAPTYTGNTACLHLNGFDLTATASRAIYGAAGVLNVMGEGTVSGYQSSGYTGATLQINTAGTSGAVNLYGGTYTMDKNAHRNAYVINIAGNGGIVNIYKTASVNATTSGKAIRCDESKLTDSVIGLYGANVKGLVYLRGPNVSKGQQLRVIIEDAKLPGTVQLGDKSSENVSVTLSGKVELGKLMLENDLRIQLEDLKPGSRIGLDAEGIFTKENTDIAKYQYYFTAVSQGYCITVKNNALRCALDYVSDLQLDANGQAFCPACKEIVTWTAISEAPSTANLPADSHSYLTADITVEKTSAIFGAPTTSEASACLHMNGHSLKNTGRYVFFGSKGILNVMGSGTVSGKAVGKDIAGTVYTNATYSAAQINLYGGTYKNTNDSYYPEGPVISIGNVGGNINIHEDVILNRPGRQAIYVGTLINKGNANLGIYGTEISGNVTIKAPVAYDASTGYGGMTSTANLENAAIHGTVTVETDERTTVNMKGGIVIGELAIHAGAPLVLDTLTDASDIKVTADGMFAKESEGAYQYANYFETSEAAKWVVVRDKTLVASERKSLPNGNKVIFFGNSRTFYGKCVIEKGQTVETQAERVGDQGYFYQICKANGYDVDVTNFTFGGHVLKDFYSETCTTRSSHHHLRELVDRNYDYVVMQTGSVDKDLGTIVETVQSMMDVFLEENPNTKFIFLVTNNVHYGNYAWRNTIKDLEQIGVTVVDWGALVNDLVNGDTTVPGGTETYHKFSFTVNATADDGYHPNMLTGYITAQMIYSAITGEKAEGQEYAFWNDPRANEAFNVDTYIKAYYSYDSTVPSNHNFEKIFASTADMTGLQQLMDRYLEEKGYLDY